MKILLLLPMLLSVTLISCDQKEAGDDLQQEEEQAQGKPPVDYRNPVCPISLPDPTVIRVDDVFYMYATEDVRNTPIMASPDLVNWRQVGTVFTEHTRPNFVKDGGVWAPDINKVGNLYVLYYTQSVWGGGDTCGIGVAISDNPSGPWTNRGKLFDSMSIGVYNSIDPFLYQEDGRNYLFWGGYEGGIHAVELSSNGLAIKPAAKPVKIVGNNYEGVAIHKKGDYYYLFASMENCCLGFDSVYKAVVGRSKSLYGPYLDKSGREMSRSNYEVVVEGDGINFFGPGHNSGVITDKNGDDWILYHCYTITTGDRVRALMLDKLSWENGWPKINYGTPSQKALRPVFK